MNENAGDVSLSVVPTPGVDLTKLEGAIDSVIDRFRREGPTAEQMKKATAGIEFGSYNRLQSMLGKAMTLASGWIYHGDPAFYAKDLTETLAVTAADVKRVAGTYLGPNRIVLSAVPTGKKNLASHPEQSAPITSPFALNKQAVP
jgi:zinc protease